MDRNVSILLVGSLGVDDLLIRTALERASFRASYGKTESVGDLTEYMAQRHWDVIILGLDGGFFRGLELIRILKQSYPTIPIIVISSDAEVTHAVAAMKAGADNYLLKENPGAILSAVENVLSIREKQQISSLGGGPLPPWNQLAHSVRDLLYIYEIDTGIVHIQDAFGTIFEAGEMIIRLAEAMKSLLSPAERFRLLRRWTESNAQGAEIWNADYTLRSIHGNAHPVEDRGFIERDEAGKPIRIVGVLMLGINDAIREASTTSGDQDGERYQQFFECMRDGVIITDLDGKVLQTNSASVRILGKSNENEIVGQSIADVLFHPCGRQDLFEALNQNDTLHFEEATCASTDGAHARQLLISATRHDNEGTGWIGLTLSDVTDLHAVQRALEVNEQRVRGIMDAAHLVVMLLSADGSILEWNNEAEQISGVLRCDAIGENYFHRFVPSEEIDRARLEVARAARGKKVIGLEGHIISRESGLRLVQWSVSALPGDTSDEVSLVAIGMDVTEKRRAEKALIANEQNLTAVMENTEDSIWSIDSNYRVRTINSGFKNKFHVLYGVALAPGMRIVDFVPDPVRTFWLEHYTRALGGERFSAQHQFHWNDELRDYEISFNPIYEGNKITGASILARDVTDLMKAAHALNYLQQRDTLLSSISRSFLLSPVEQVHHWFESALSECAEFAQFDAAILAVFSEGPERNIEALYQFKTHSQSEQIQALFQPDGVCHWWQAIISQTAPVSFGSLDDLPPEARNEKAYLSSMGVTSGYVLPLRIEEKTIGVWCCFGVGGHREWGAESEFLCQTLGELVTKAVDRKRAYARAVADRAMLAGKVDERSFELRSINAEFARAAMKKDEFLANMLHELRTPLTAILAQTELLQEQLAPQLTEKQRKALNAIDASSRRLHSIITDTLDLARIEAGRLTMQFDSHGVDLLCKSSLLFIRQMAMNKSIQVHYKNPDPKLKMDTDGTYVKQVLVNLLNNAVISTPEGGSISLSVKPRESRNEVVFQVSDSGNGTEDRQMAQLFKPFAKGESKRSHHDEGTGLGLALVASLTDILGGSVSLESVARKGNTFTVVLPLKRNGAPTGETQNPCD